METIFNANFHLNGGVEFRVGAQRVDHNVQLFSDVIESSDHCGTKEVSANVQEGTENKYCHFITSSN